MAGLTVLDASVLIAHFTDGDVHHDRAGRVLAVAGELRASVITLAEALVTPTRRGALETARAGLARLGVEEVPLGSDAARRLAALRADTGLKLPDCCVLLAARDAGADTIATFNDRLAAAAEGLGLSVA